MKLKETDYAWIARAVILAVVLWAGSTLISVDTRMGLLEYRMTMIERHHSPEGIVK